LRPSNSRRRVSTSTRGPSNPRGFSSQRTVIFLYLQ